MQCSIGWVTRYLAVNVFFIQFVPPATFLLRTQNRGAVPFPRKKPPRKVACFSGSIPTGRVCKLLTLSPACPTTLSHTGDLGYPKDVTEASEVEFPTPRCHRRPTTWKGLETPRLPPFEPQDPGGAEAVEEVLLLLLELGHLRCGKVEPASGKFREAGQRGEVAIL